MGSRIALPLYPRTAYTYGASGKGTAAPYVDWLLQCSYQSCTHHDMGFVTTHTDDRGAVPPSDSRLAIDLYFRGKAVTILVVASELWPTICYASATVTSSPRSFCVICMPFCRLASQTQSRPTLLVLPRYRWISVHQSLHVLNCLSNPKNLVSMPTCYTPIQFLFPRQLTRTEF